MDRLSLTLPPALGPSVGQPGVAASTLCAGQESKGLRTLGSCVTVHPSICPAAISLFCSLCQRCHWAWLSPALGRITSKQPFSLKLRGI